MFSETFFVGLYTSAIGFILAIGAQCYKSKCKEINLCCLKITRDIEMEEKIDEIELKKIDTPTNSH